jgi:hypothetical protein
MPRRRANKNAASLAAETPDPQPAPTKENKDLRDDTKLAAISADDVDLSDVTKIDVPAVRRRRGRPLKDPGAGPATTAARAAAQRKRIAKENDALVMCLWKALHTLQWLGRVNEVAAAFHAHDKGFEAVRRINPGMASQMFNLVTESWTLRTEFFNRLNGDYVTRGRAKGSIVFDGHEYVAAKDGRVLRDGEPTEYLMAGAIGFYTVTNTVVSQPPRHHGDQDGRSMALLDVAIMIFEKETGTRVTSKNRNGEKSAHPLLPKKAKPAQRK